MLEKHLTIKQVAERLQLSDRTIRRWIHSGKIRAVELPGGRFGTEWRIPMSALTSRGFAVEGEAATENGNGHQ